MGCCASKVPSFPSPSIADGILPSYPLDDDCREAIKIIPHPSMMSLKIGIFRQTDQTNPSFIFSQIGGSVKCLKVQQQLGATNLETVQVAVIKTNWQSSRGYKQSGTFNDDHHDTMHENKTFTITTSAAINDREESLELRKTFSGSQGISSICEIDKGYTITDDTDNKCEILSLNGNVMAYIFDGAKNMNPMMMSGPRDYMKYMKAPMAIYVRSGLSESELTLTLCIMATASDRLLHSAMTSTDDGGNAFDDRHHHNDQSHEGNYAGNYYGSGDNYGGGEDFGGGGDYGGEGDFGGGGDGGDWGGE